MIILVKGIQGYNNILTLATDDMKFGVNPHVNYFGKRKGSDKKVHHPEQPANHLDDLDGGEEETPKITTPKVSTPKVPEVPKVTKSDT